MHDWKEHCARDFEEIIIGLEVPRRTPRLCICGAPADWRCEDCFGRPEVCRTCCRKAHKLHPWHNITCWDNRGFYKPSTISELGLVLHTGHDGEPCPAVAMNVDGEANNEEEWEEMSDRNEELSDAGEPVANGEQDRGHVEAPWNDIPRDELRYDYFAVVVDISGVHKLPVRFCKCPNAKPASEQLLRMKLYPASHRRPQTFFTFAVLDDFLLHNRVCKTSAANYYTLLQRRTNPLSPAGVVVRNTYFHGL